MAVPNRTLPETIREHVTPQTRPPLRWVRATHDGCPECLGRYNEPHALVADLRDNWMRGAYECRHCGHAWWVTWELELTEMAG